MNCFQVGLFWALSHYWAAFWELLLILPIPTPFGPSQFGVWVVVVRACGDAFFFFLKAGHLAYFKQVDGCPKRVLRYRASGWDRQTKTKHQKVDLFPPPEKKGPSICSKSFLSWIPPLLPTLLVPVLDIESIENILILCLPPSPLKFYCPLEV